MKNIISLLLSKNLIQRVKRPIYHGSLPVLLHREKNHGIGNTFKSIEMNEQYVIGKVEFISAPFNARIYDVHGKQISEGLQYGSKWEKVLPNTANTTTAINV